MSQILGAEKVASKFHGANIDRKLVENKREFIQQKTKVINFAANLIAAYQPFVNTSNSNIQNFEMANAKNTSKNVFINTLFTCLCV